MNVLTVLAFPLLVACAETASPEDSAPDDTAAATDPVMVVVTSDYEVGTLNLVTLEGALIPDLLPTSGDTVVVADGSRLLYLDRSANVLRAYDDRQFGAPTWEVNVGDGANPVSAARCGEKLFVARYARPSLLVLDPASGQTLGEVDLGAFSDADGSPEPDSLVAAPNGKLYLTMNQLDFLGTYGSVDGSGTLAEIDCDALTVTESWDVGPNPHASAIGDGARIAVYGGDYFLPDFSGPALDGGLWIFDTTTRTLGAQVLDEAALGGNVGNVAIDAEGRGLTTLDDGLTWSVSCFDATTGTTWATFDPAAYVQEAHVGPDGGAWLVQRSPFSGDAGTVGVVRVGLDTCDAAPPIQTTLEPYSLAFLR
jgi:hypothetical protein